MLSIALRVANLGVIDPTQSPLDHLSGLLGQLPLIHSKHRVCQDSFEQELIGLNRRSIMGHL